MRRTEAVTDRAATKEDLVVIDADIKKGGVSSKAARVKDHRIYLNEAPLYSGFADELVGLEKGR